MTPAQEPTPTIVFIHGAGSNSDFWHEQQSTFAGGLFVDLPGHASARRKEPAGEGLSSIEAYADWVAAQVEREGLRDVVLDGHSMGGAVALTLALRRPAWLRALVLTGTSARLPVRPELLASLRMDYPVAVDYIVEHSFAHARGELSYAERAQRYGTRRRLLRTLQAVTLGDYEACARFDVSARLNEIDVPTLCIVGAEDRMTWPPYSVALHREIANSELRVIEGAGHMLPIEQPDAYNRAVEEFVRGLASPDRA